MPFTWEQIESILSKQVLRFLTGRQHVEVVLGLANDNSVSSVVATLITHIQIEMTRTSVSISLCFLAGLISSS